MKKKPHFSVIVACYNEEKIIERCIKSILNQDFSDFELVLINDGSTDNTKQILDKYKQNKKIVIIHKSTNEDKPKRINEAVAASKGRIIAVTDADSIVPKNWLSSFKKEFEKYSEAAAIGGVYESAEQDAVSLAGNMFERIFMDTGLIPNLLPGANSAYKKQDFIESGGYPLRKWGADAMIDLNMRKTGKKIRISRNIKVKTGYPKTVKASLKRKFVWGGGLASILDGTKFRLNFLLRPAYYTVLCFICIATIFSYFVNQFAFLISLILFLTILLLPSLALSVLSIFWILKEKKYAYSKALPLMLFLPTVQEFSYFIGFLYVMSGGKLENAWRQKK
ncbi:glycosyltransferase [Candidatus Woesearchaeota archaeon]|nr:glycosyltransferase [Candidatus Woesearchaeota archaeon]